MPRYYAIGASIRLSVSDLIASTTHNPAPRKNAEATQNAELAESILKTGRVLAERDVPCLDDIEYGARINWLGDLKHMPFYLVHAGFDVFRTDTSTQRETRSYNCQSSSSRAQELFPNVPDSPLTSLGTTPAVTPEPLDMVGHDDCRATRRSTIPIRASTPLSGAHTAVSECSSSLPRPARRVVEAPLQPRALSIQIKLSPQTFLRGSNAKRAQDVKIDILFNGELVNSTFVPERFKVHANMLTLQFSGKRTHFLREQPWVIVPPGQDVDGSIKTSKRAKPGEGGAQWRWDQIQAALREEADSRGFNLCGQRPPVGEFFAALSELSMPVEVETMQKPGGHRFGVIDVVLSAGKGKKYDANISYLTEPTRLIQDEYRPMSKWKTERPSIRLTNKLDDTLSDNRNGGLERGRPCEPPARGTEDAMDVDQPVYNLEPQKAAGGDGIPPAERGARPTTSSRKRLGSLRASFEDILRSSADEVRGRHLSSQAEDTTATPTGRNESRTLRSRQVLAHRESGSKGKKNAAKKRLKKKKPTIKHLSSYIMKQHRNQRPTSDDGELAVALALGPQEAAPSSTIASQSTQLTPFSSSPDWQALELSKTPNITRDGLIRGLPSSTPEGVAPVARRRSLRGRLLPTDLGNDSKHEVVTETAGLSQILGVSSRGVIRPGISERPKAQSGAQSLPYHEFDNGGSSSRIIIRAQDLRIPVQFGCLQHPSFKLPVPSSSLPIPQFDMQPAPQAPAVASPTGAEKERASLSRPEPPRHLKNVPFVTPFLSEDCIISYARSKGWMDGGNAEGSSLPITRQIRCEKTGQFKEDSILMGVRFLIG